MSKPKEYKLKIDDLLQIPEDRFDDFLIDLKKWHSAVRNTKKMIETIAKATALPIPKEMLSMRWIDDGKHEGRIIISQKSAPTEGDTK